MPHHTTGHLVHRPRLQGRVRLVRKTRLVQSKTQLGLKAPLDQKTLRIRRLHLAREAHRVRRTRPAHKPHLDPRIHLVLKARLVQELLPGRSLNPIPRRKQLGRKNGGPSSETDSCAAQKGTTLPVWFSNGSLGRATDDALVTIPSTPAGIVKARP